MQYFSPTGGSLARTTQFSQVFAIKTWWNFTPCVNKKWSTAVYASSRRGKKVWLLCYLFMPYPYTAYETQNREKSNYPYTYWVGEESYCTHIHIFRQLLLFLLCSKLHYFQTLPKLYFSFQASKRRMLLVPAYGVCGTMREKKERSLSHFSQN